MITIIIEGASVERAVNGREREGRGGEERKGEEHNNVTVRL